MNSYYIPNHDNMHVFGYYENVFSFFRENKTTPKDTSKQFAINLPRMSIVTSFLGVPPFSHRWLRSTILSECGNVLYDIDKKHN